jgi:hypothetical protein
MAVRVVIPDGWFDGGEKHIIELIGQGVDIEVIESEKGQALLYVLDVTKDTIAIFQSWKYAIVLDGIEALEATRTPIADELQATQPIEPDGGAE